MSRAVTGRAGHALAERYEQLRQSVADSRAGHHGGDGLALLMRKGMAAWMSSLEDQPPHRTGSPVCPSEASRPESLERSLIDILAAMTMATVLELGHDNRPS